MVLGVSALHTTRGDAEHLLHQLVDLAGTQDVTACTHFVDTPWRHDAISVELPTEGPIGDLFAALPARSAAVLMAADGTRDTGDPQLIDAARQADQAHAHRSSGRAVIFPGQYILTGAVPIARVVADTAVEAIESSHGPFDDDALLITGGFIRPVFSDGQLVILVGHNDPTQLVPWEVPNPRSCCADH